MSKHSKYKIIRKTEIWCPYNQTYGDIYSESKLKELQEDCSNFAELKVIAATPLFLGGLGCTKCRYFVKGGTFTIGCSYERSNK